MTIRVKNILLLILVVFSTNVISAQSVMLSHLDFFTIQDLHLKGDTISLNLYMNEAGYDKVKRTYYDIFYTSSRNPDYELNIDERNWIWLRVQNTTTVERTFFHLGFKKYAPEFIKLDTKGTEYHLKYVFPEGVISHEYITDYYVIFILFPPPPEKLKTTPKERLKTTPPGLFSYKLSENVLTDMYINKGEKIAISAKGALKTLMSVNSVGPNGKSGFKSFRLIKEFPYGCLMASIGNNGQWFEVGEGTTISADQSGYLKLYINDNTLKTKSGNFNVTCYKL